MNTETFSSNQKRLPWVIVLAGGRGTRLSQLTSALNGQPLPKQYARLDGVRTPLQNTVKRALWLTAAERVMVVVSESYRKLAASQLEDFPGVKLVVQPLSGGTALGILLPLAMIERNHADEDVVVMPSDHHFDRPWRFIDAIEAVLNERRRGDALVLLGSATSNPQTDFGWIVPMATAEAGLLAPVRKFVEKPSKNVALGLMKRGGLLSTFVTIGTARGFMDAFCRTLPKATNALRGSVKLGRWNALRFAFVTFGGINFSRSVLERLPDLLVATLPDCGWADLGTAERVRAVFGTHAERRHAAGVSSPRLARQ